MEFEEKDEEFEGKKKEEIEGKTQGIFHSGHCK
jgi:hypothetical protein